jgi:hypothetical protein
MKRIIMVATLALLLAAMMLAMAMPAFADATLNENNCFGSAASSLLPGGSSHGAKGKMLVVKRSLGYEMT